MINMTTPLPRQNSTRSAVLLALLMCGGGCVHSRATPPPPSAIPATKPDHEHAVETGIPVASTPQGLMKDGAEKQIQLKLKHKGLLTAAQCTGQLDMTTRQALRTFQKAEGLPTTGLPSYETVVHLGLDLDSIFHTVGHPAEPARQDG
jgi:peptidoglycan hydrolase-like protein with peptidoglycan-binding domain